LVDNLTLDFAGSESGRDGFGSANENQEVKDLQKWQFEFADPEADHQNDPKYRKCFI